jgi:large subunit ribosomal protein L22
MSITARLNYLRIAPRKVRLVADLIRGKKVEPAQRILTFTVKKAAKPLLKLLDSALAGAKRNFQLEAAGLYVSKITVDEGPKYKRWMPRARGAAGQIQKKTSHITLVLSEISPVEKRKRGIKKVKVKENREEKLQKPQKEKLRPPKFRKSGTREAKPKIGKGIIKKIFRRKAF